MFTITELNILACSMAFILSRRLYFGSLQRLPKILRSSYEICSRAAR